MLGLKENKSRGGKFFFNEMLEYHHVGIERLFTGNPLRSVTKTG